jgi:hypothetical protein
MAMDDDRLLGQMATMPFPMWWGDREVRASAGMDYFVRPDAQGRGLGIALSEAWADHVDVALALGLTPSSYPLFKKIFTDVGPVPAYLRPIDPAAVARRRWGTAAGTIAGPFVGLGLSLTTRRLARADALEVREVTTFSDEYDASGTVCGPHLSPSSGATPRTSTGSTSGARFDSTACSRRASTAS